MENPNAKPAMATRLERAYSSTVHSLTTPSNPTSTNPTVNQPLPRPTQLPTQPIPNPNNKVVQPTCNAELPFFPKYVISPTEFQNIHLRSGRVVQDQTSPIIQEQDDEENPPKSDNQDTNPSKEKQNTTQKHPDEQESLPEPPYPERLNIEKSPTQQEFDLLGELRNVCVKIPLFQAIKDVPIYAKVVRELCLKKPGRKKKDPKTVHVIGKLADLMLGKIFMAKYMDPGSLVFKVNINITSIANTLVDLGAPINIMTKETMEKLQLSGLRPTPTVLQLAYRSIVKPEGMLEDIIVSVDSWEYPTDFMVLKPKAKLGGYPLILGRP
jgi:hypothetical protein